MPHVIKLKRDWKVLGLLAVDTIVFNATNARSTPALVLVVGFVALLASLYYVFYAMLGFARLYGLAFKNKRRLAGYMTVMTGFLLALQSIGELNSRDILVLLPLALIGYGYGLYARAPAGAPDA